MALSVRKYLSRITFLAVFGLMTLTLPPTLNSGGSCGSAGTTGCDAHAANITAIIA